MTIEQYSTFLTLVPQIEKTLQKMGERIPRPVYDDSASAAVEAEEDHEGSAQKPGEGRSESRNNDAFRKSNIEATSDEDEDD